jgi:hypothetical protein
MQNHCRLTREGTSEIMRHIVARDMLRNSPADIAISAN